MQRCNTGFILFWTSMFIMIGSIIGITMSAIYFYQPVVQHHKKAECSIINCRMKYVTCCQNFFSTNYCTTNEYPEITFTLTLGTTAYIKNESHICDGPIDQNYWVYNDMCNDNKLKKMTCYYNDKFVLESLHLSDVFQTKPTLGIGLLILFGLLLSASVVYMVVFMVKYIRNYHK